MDKHILEPDSFYQHGWQSWNVAAWRPPDLAVRYPQVKAHRLQSTDPAHLDDAFPGGASVGALVDADNQVSLLGALAMDAWVTNTPQGMAGSDGGDWFEAKGDEATVFRAYADALAARLGARTGHPGNVWCSWYSFYHGVSEPLMAQVLLGLEGLAFDVVQIDDGWQRANGDWQANDKFPSGMTDMARRIGATGRTPGLWLAPFIVDPASKLFERYPEMVLRDKSGDPVIAAYNWGPSYTLDVTRADAQNWLVEQMAAIVAAGFTYLKLDFLYSAALPGCFVVDTGREQAYRRASELIRATVGDDVYLLACGAPVVPSIGIYDGLRVGPDVSEVWDNVDRTLHLGDRAGPGGADAITTTLHRLWMKDLIDIDPDIAYFRSRFCMLTQQQKQLIADLAEICDFKANSDLPDWLLPAERERLQQFLQHQAEVKQLDRYRFSVDGRNVDFGPVVNTRPW